MTTQGSNPFSRTSKNRTRRGPYCTGVCFRNFFDQNVNQRAITASIHNNALKRAAAQSHTVWMKGQPTSGPQSQSNHAGRADMKTRYKVHWRTRKIVPTSIVHHAAIAAALTRFSKISSMGCNSFPNRWRRLIEEGIICSFELQPAHDDPQLPNCWIISL